MITFRAISIFFCSNSIINSLNYKSTNHIKSTFVVFFSFHSVNSVNSCVAWVSLLFNISNSVFFSSITAISTVYFSCKGWSDSYNQSSYKTRLQSLLSFLSIDRFLHGTSEEWNSAVSRSPLSLPLPSRCLLHSLLMNLPTSYLSPVSG